MHKKVWSIQTHFLYFCIYLSELKNHWKINYSNSSNSTPYWQDDTSVWNISSVYGPASADPLPRTYHEICTIYLWKHFIVLMLSDSSFVTPYIFSSNLLLSELMCKFSYRSQEILDHYQSVKDVNIMRTRLRESVHIWSGAYLYRFLKTWDRSIVK